VSSLARRLEGHTRPARKDENGVRRCRWCEGPVLAKNRRTFCSDPCVHEFRLRSDPGYLRAQVFKRDKGVCASCDVDTVELQTKLRARWQFDLYGCKRVLAACSIPESRLFGGTLWDADHILPVIEGGGLVGLEGMRTLCIPCHVDATAELARRRAKGRQP